MSYKTFSSVRKVCLVMAILAVASMLSLVFTVSTQAAEIVTGDPDAVVAEGDVIDDDVFISGERVVVDGIVKGDLFASGLEVILNGTVEGNVFTIGELLTINGTVGGNVYSGGCALTLGSEARIERSINTGGFSLITEAGSSIGRNVFATVFQTKLDGDVSQDVKVATGAFEFNGSAGGDVNVELGETCPICIEFVPIEAVTPGLRINEKAKIDGIFDYQVTSGDFEEIDITNVEVLSTEIEVAALRDDAIKFLVAQEIRRVIGEVIALLIVGGLLVYLLPNRVKSMMGYIKDHPLPNFGWGLLMVVLFPLVLLLAVAIPALLIWIINLVTLGKLTGFLVGVSGVSIISFITIFVFTLSFITKAVFGYLVGKTVLGRFVPTAIEGRWGTVWSLVTGVMLYEIVRIIPIFGWVAALVVILMGAGAIFRMIRDSLSAKTSVA